jgi:hypothetical protein
MSRNDTKVLQKFHVLLQHSPEFGKLRAML